MDDFDLRMSDKVRPLYEAVKAFIREEVDPITEEYYRLGEGRSERWGYGEGQLELLEGAKAKARAQGLWNFFLPDAETGEGLTNLDYAYIANELGKNRLASECLNCSAPDTGNMEVLERVGTAQQKEEWLEPLLNGQIRSAYCMTEPRVMSSDAKQIETEAVLDGDEWVINGEKHWTSGAGDPRCKVMICMVKTDPEAPKHLQQSQILVPMDTPGVNIVRPLKVFNMLDAPHGHMRVKLENVRVPKDNIILGPGRGFEISQGRLGPGRIHHCMRSIGSAEKALELLCERATEREAFGRPLYKLGGNIDIIADARMNIEQARLLTLKTAWMMDRTAPKEARIWISMIKTVVPNMALKVIDDAIQMHGGIGVSQDTPLAEMWSGQRTLRLADGPDAVHRMVVGRNEIKQYLAEAGEVAATFRDG